MLVNGAPSVFLSIWTMLSAKYLSTCPRQTKWIQHHDITDNCRTFDPFRYLFSLTIQIWWKFRLVLIQISTKLHVSRFEFTPLKINSPVNLQQPAVLQSDSRVIVLIVFLSFMTKSISAWHFVFEIQTKQYHWVPFQTNRYCLPAMMQDNSISYLIR